MHRSGGITKRDESLIDELRDQSLCPDMVPMPQWGLASPWQPLPEEQIQTFADWTCAGAKGD